MDNGEYRFDQIIEPLGVASYRASGTAIFCVDCIEGMRMMEGGSVNLCVTSPPYNIGKEYESPLKLEGYLAWCEAWIREVYRLIRFDGAFWLNLGYISLPGRARAMPLPYLMWQHVPFFLVQEVVWNYGAGVATKHSFSPRNEKFLWYVKNQDDYVFNLDAVRDPKVKYPHQKKNGKLKCNPLGKNPTDVWTIPKVTSGANRASDERTEHPAQFPVAVIERIIKACSNEGDIIMDPFIGSGTTAEVAMRLRRKVIGFEVSPGYVGLAQARLDKFRRRNEADAAQVKLFSGV